MSVEFEKIGPGRAKSSRGFTVVWRPPGRVDYTDANGTVQVDVEPMVKPFRIAVYPRSRALGAMPEDRADDIVANVMRALEYLGHKAERWDSLDTWGLEPGDWDKYK